MSRAHLVLVAVLFVLGGCASHGPAPVEERGVGAAPAKADGPPVAATPAASDVKTGFYTVKKGDTLYSIALDSGHDYKDIAAWNSLDNPNLIRIGQQLRVTPPEGAAPVAVARPVTSSTPVEIKSVAAANKPNTDAFKRAPKGGKLPWSEDALARARQPEATPQSPETRPEPRPVEAKAAEKPVVAGDELDWVWPASGKLLAPYAEGSNKGIDIAGKAGDPVLASASGVVSYAGAGLRGYGNLVVLRHNASFLSVYAHNSKLLVKEKDTVAKGQKIAEIGSSDAEGPRLHFEIRRQGKPADPQKFLPAR